jgi:hypothetical protein
MWWLGAALAGETTWEFPDDVVEGELERPAASWMAARPRLGPARALRLEDEALETELRMYALLDRGADAAAEQSRADGLRAEALAVRRAALDPRDAGGLAGLAYALEGARRPDEAAEVWIALLKTAPESPHAPPGRLSLAERAFAAGDVVGASAWYAAALPDPVLGDYAAYKLAWCDFNLGRFPEAAQRLAALGAKADGLLGQEARRDLTLMASSLPDADVVRLVGVACAGAPACVAETGRRVDERRVEQGRPPLAR